MKKSRVLWIATAFLTVCVMLVTGCSTDKSAVKLDSSNPVSLEVWHYYNGPQKIAFDDMVSEFNETIGQ